MSCPAALDGATHLWSGVGTDRVQLEATREESDCAIYAFTRECLRCHRHEMLDGATWQEWSGP